MTRLKLRRLPRPKDGTMKRVPGVNIKISKKGAWHDSVKLNYINSKIDKTHVRPVTRADRNYDRAATAGRYLLRVTRALARGLALLGLWLGRRGLSLSRAFARFVDSRAFLYQRPPARYEIRHVPRHRLDTSREHFNRVIRRTNA